MSPATARLFDEWKKWRKNPLMGFACRPMKNKDGTLCLYQFKCLIPGKKGTPWEGGKFKMLMKFDENYPRLPPKCTFDLPFFHPNVHLSGRICVSTLSNDWCPAFSFKNILLSIQTLLDEPNPNNPAHLEAAKCYRNNPTAYTNRVKDLANQNRETQLL